MISYRFVPISSQKGVLFLRHPVCLKFADILICSVELLGLFMHLMGCPNFGWPQVLQQHVFDPFLTGFAVPVGASWGAWVHAVVE